MIWRYCPRCASVGPTQSKRCTFCASTGAIAPRLEVLTVPVDALRAAARTGGIDAIVEMLANFDCDESVLLVNNVFAILGTDL